MLFKLFIIIGSILLLHSCASISPPTGGPKDETPPNLLKSIPDDGQLNYQSKEFKFLFNEYIVLNNLNDQLIINPPIEGTYEAVARKNRLSIMFEKDLKPNTTYTFNFRQGIKDMTEGNVNPEMKIAFSTGLKLDTLEIKGSVKDLLTNVATENLSINLYKKSDTSIITEHKPLYFTKTDKAGNYLLENIKEDAYYIYALKDNNNNLYYDNENETIDSDSVNLTKDTVINFTVSKHYNIPPKVNSTTSTTKLTTLKLSKGVVKGIVKPLIKTDSLHYNIAGNEIKIYHTFSSLDSLPVYIEVSDSANNVLKDTVNIIFPKEKDKQKEKKLKGTSLSLTPLIVDKKVVSPVDSLRFSLNIPLKQINYENITIKTDSNNIQVSNNQYFIYNKTDNSITIRKNLIFKDSIIIDILKGAILSVFGDSLTSQKIVFTPKSENDYAIFGGRIVTKKKDIILQLLNDKYQIIDEVATSGSFKFDYVPPGSYHVRAIVDRNNNSKWDPGNFNKNVLPEEVYFYKEKVELRANWEVTDMIFPF